MKLENKEDNNVSKLQNENLDKQNLSSASSGSMDYKIKKKKIK